MRTPARATVLIGGLLAVAMPNLALAAPVDEKIELLRARPTGMDEAQWRKQRREIAKQLGEIRSPKAVDALIEVVETERFDAVLSAAIDGLGKQGDKRALPALQKVYADRSIDSFVREQAGKAIEALGATPADDARLVGGAASGTPGTAGATLGGPQLGVMGAASVASENELAQLDEDKPLPDSVRARDRAFSFLIGAADVAVNTRVRDQAVVADAGVGVLARYVDERHRWGWSVDALLEARVANGDNTVVPAGGGGDDGDVLYLREGLAGVGEAHVYFGKTDAHAFGELAVSQRLTYVNVEEIGDGAQDELSNTRFAMDLVPAAGLGWGRFLNAGSDLMVDAIIEALEAENILARDLTPEDRKAIRDAVYRRSNTFSSYPRLAATLTVLRQGGYLARPAGPRLVHRLRSIVEDPSYLDRGQGIRVRAGFLYGVPIAQGDFFRREGDALGAPFVQADAGVQLSTEREISADLRFWYDVISDRSFTVDVGAQYTRYLHTKFHDYAGQWFVGVRGGASQRTYRDVADDADIRIGYLASATAGYAYGFSRGSQIDVAGNVGVDSGALLIGLGVGLRLGLGRGSLVNPSPRTTPNRKPAPNRETRSGR